MSAEEEKYKKLRESLLALPKVKAKNDFESRLFRKIHEHENRGRHYIAHKEPKENSFINMLANLFRPSLVPAIGLTVVLLAAIVVYFAYFNELNKDSSLQQEYSSTQKNGEFVIYVKKDGERVIDETARDIVSSDTKQPSTLYSSPTDHGTDGYVKPLEQPTIDAERKLKDDRISDEQKIEMEKESKKESDIFKSQPKVEDGLHMKKSGKTDKTKDVPSNIREEKLDTGNKNEGDVIKQEEKGEMNQQTEGKANDEDDKERLARSRKDSLKVKDKGIEEQNDTIEK